MKNSKAIGRSPAPVIVRTDFSDDKKWAEIKIEVSRPVGPYGFLASIAFLQSEVFEGISVEKLQNHIDDEYNHDFIMVADEITFANETATLLVVDLWEKPGRSFRTELGQVQNIENNLSEANMDFVDYSERVDGDGIFRGFEN